jgi:hypothetical protein
VLVAGLRTEYEHVVQVVLNRSLRAAHHAGGSLAGKNVASGVVTAAASVASAFCNIGLLGKTNEECSVSVWYPGEPPIDQVRSLLLAVYFAGKSVAKYDCGLK